MDRRDFARGVLGGAFAALLGVPGVASVLDPARRSARARWTAAGPAADVPADGAKPFEYRVDAAWETRTENGYLVRDGDAVVALSATCTHLGCRVRFRDGKFRCPCHGGVFSRTGAPEEGPVEKPLARFKVRVEDGEVRVRA